MTSPRKKKKDSQFVTLVTDRRNVKIESSTQNDVIKKPSPAGHKLRVGEAAVLVSVVLLQNLQANNCHHSIVLLQHLP